MEKKSSISTSDMSDPQEKNNLVKNRSNSSVESDTLILRVEIEDYEELKSSRIVTMFFDRSKTVKHALLQLARKSSIFLAADDAVQHYALYIPETAEDNTGLKMTNERLLSSYNFKNRDRIILKKIIEKKEESNEKVTRTRSEKKEKSFLKKLASRTITRHNSSYHASFAVPLSDALENGTLLGIPTVVEKAMDFLENNGLAISDLFTKAVDINEMNELRGAFDEGEDYDFVAKKTSPYLVASLLKLFFELLPEPLLTYNLYDIVLREYNSDESNFAWNIKYFIKNLPTDNNALLARIMDFLKLIEEKSKAQVDDCIRIFLPGIIKPHPKIVLSKEEQEGNTAKVIEIIKIFIKEQDVLFVSSRPKNPKVHPGEYVVVKSDRVLTHPSLVHNSERVESKLTLPGIIWITNYRLLWKEELAKERQDDFFKIEIPLGFISEFKKIPKGKLKNITGAFVIQCKDLRVHVFAFQSRQNYKTVYSHLKKYFSNQKIDKFFCFSYNPKFKTENGWFSYDPLKEYTRQGINWSKFRISHVNMNFASPSYPDSTIVPTSIADDFLQLLSKNRSEKRFLAYVWGHTRNKASIFRVGSIIDAGNENKETKKFIDVLLKLNPTNGDKLRVIDPSIQGDIDYTALFPQAEYLFLDLPNYQEVFQDYGKLCDLAIFPAPSMEPYKNWLRHIQLICQGALQIVNFIENGETVLIQESSSTDSTFSLISLAQILLDPYYRTIEGFSVLIEKDWLGFGYPFAKEKAPFFLQFIESVWQMWIQHPSSFEFNEEFLHFIGRHKHSCRFGTFINNNERERIETKVKTVSVWTQVYAEKKRFINSFYQEEKKVLTPSLDFLFWKSYYLYFSQYVSQYLRKISQIITKTSRSQSKRLALSSKGLSILPEESKQLSHIVSLRLEQNEFNIIPFTICFLEQLKELSLSKNQISMIPHNYLSLIAKMLVSLEELDLNGNQLGVLPKSIVKFQNLKSLNLNHNRLVSLPSNISELTSLQFLYIRKNFINQFPSLSNLPNLKHLDLSRNTLSQFPENLSIPNLKVLKLSKNGISKLPIHFSLDSLEDLNLSNQEPIKLSEFPPEFFERLPNLKKLKLKGNGISTLPSTISKLTKLELLNLGSNNFSQIPPSIFKLTSLTALILKQNNLKKLPVEISALQKLEKLNLHHNQLTSLPPAIGKLEQLQFLDISYNELDSLPPTLSLLSLLNFVYEKNKLRHIPKSITSSGVQSVLGYLKDLMKGSEPCYRMRIIVVGQENVGKTSLCNCLRKKGNKNTENLASLSTDGINIENWPPFTITIEGEDGKPRKQEVELTMWDFAGQEIYYATHQFFLSKRSLYILVWNIEDEAENSKISFWLHSIKARTKKVPVYLVGTHLDKRPKEMALFLLSKLESKYKAMFPTLELYFRVVSCSNGEGINKLRQDIEETSLKQKIMGESIPISTLLLEKQIVEKSMQLMPPVLTKAEFTALGATCNITDPKELSRVSKTLHELGTLIHFESDPKLNELVVLDPKWLTEVMATILTTRHNFAKNGILKHSNLFQIWREPKYPQKLYSVLLSILERFEITYPLSPLTEKFDGVNLIPSLLPVEKPKEIEDIWSPFPNIEQTQTGRKYCFEFIPFGLFGRIIIRLLNFNKSALYWRNGILLGTTSSPQMILVELDPNSNSIHINCRSIEGSPTIPNYIIESIETLIRSWYKINMSIFIPCVHCVEERVPDPFYFTYENCESHAVQGKQFINCEWHDCVIPVRLDKLAPDLTMVAFDGCKILYDELQIEEKIGEGGGATVYKGKWMNEIVAVKMLRVNPANFINNEDSFTRIFNEFRREIQIMSSLEHPCLVTLKGLCFEPLCIVAEYMLYGDLYHFVRKQDSDLEWPMVLKIACDIAAGMSFLHSAKPPIIHRDLKSANVLLASLDLKEVVAKITDFGLSGAVETVSSLEVANPRWLAPEVMKKEEFTEASDVYSFGIVLWELLTRKIPFDETSFDSVVEEKVKSGERPKIPNHCPNNFSKLIGDCWQENPKSRPNFKDIKLVLHQMKQNLEEESGVVIGLSEGFSFTD